jgi:hypothetical protein
MIRRHFVNLALGLILLVFVIETTLRATLGIGTPVLVLWDARYEYRMASNQSILRFRKRIETNALGLRSRPFTVTKSDPKELRVLVVGDSVIQGGSHVDQGSLATSILEWKLQERWKRPVLVINASANSWGPANQLAFLEAEGTFDADIAVVVLSSHDLVDLPTNMELARKHDGEVMNRPVSAITELLGMAWARVMPGAMPAALDETDAARVAEGGAAVRALLERLKEHVPTVTVALHWDAEEQSTGVPRPAHDELVAIVASLGLPLWELGPALASASRSGSDAVNPLRPMMADRIHPTALGQEVLAEELLRRMSEIAPVAHE